MAKNIISLINLDKNISSIRLKAINCTSLDVFKFVGEEIGEININADIKCKYKGEKGEIFRNSIKQLYKIEKYRILILATTDQVLDEVSEIINNSIINFDDSNDSKVNPGITMKNFIRFSPGKNMNKDFLHNMYQNSNYMPDSEKSRKILLERHRIFLSTIKFYRKNQPIFDSINCNTAIIYENSRYNFPQKFDLLIKFDV